jgi:ABC-type dipeptide/oligopeptide/nickel transport system permease component
MRMTFWSIVRQRCWGLILVVAGVCIITFIISHMIPGDPARLLAGERTLEAGIQLRQMQGTVLIQRSAARRRPHHPHPAGPPAGG